MVFLQANMVMCDKSELSVESTSEFAQYWFTRTNKKHAEEKMMPL